VRRFAHLTAGDLDDGFNVVLVGSKADEIDAEPGEIESNLVSQVGLLGARAVAVSQLLASSSRCRLLREEDLAAIQHIAADKELADIAKHGWEPLRKMWRERARERERERERVLADDGLDHLAKVCGTTRGIVQVLPRIRDGSVTKLAELAGLWDRLSELARLEAELGRLIEDADVFTVNAVSGRLRRLGAKLGPVRRELIQSELARLRREPAFGRLDRRAAALALDTPALSYVDEGERQQAAAILADRPIRCPAPDLADLWQLRANKPGRSSLARQVAEIVAKAASERGANKVRPSPDGPHPFGED
jgi:hypothetical protein